MEVTRYQGEGAKLFISVRNKILNPTNHLIIQRELIVGPTLLFPNFWNNFNQLTQFWQCLFLSFVVIFTATLRNNWRANMLVSYSASLYRIRRGFFSMIYHLFFPQMMKSYTFQWNNPRELKRNKPLFHAFKEFSLVFSYEYQTDWLRNVCLSKLLRKTV